MPMGGASGKRKTLYGRFDDYADTERGTTENGGRAIRLSDVAGSARRQGGTRRASQTAPTAPSQEGSPAHATIRVQTDSQFVVLRIAADEEGGTLTVTLESPEEGGVRLRRKIPLTVEQYAALGIQPGEISQQTAEALLRAGQLCLAIRRASALLEYGDMSARSLVHKLTARGVDRDVATEAADWLTAHGMLREDAAALARASEDARKGWGPRRIYQDLLAHGYPSDVVEAALDVLNDPDDPAFVDFDDICRQVLQRKIGLGSYNGGNTGSGMMPLDRAARAKLIASMMRLGFAADMVTEAMRDITRGE